MAEHLEGEGGGVHAAAEAVLRFWLEETPAEKHFEKDDALDATIASRFGALRDEVLVTRANGWRDDPRGTLAAIILLDQFSRNIYRGKAEAFAGDRLARELALHAIDEGWDAAMTEAERHFLYMPLMHAEDPVAQRKSLALFEALGDAEQLHYARKHAEVIDRFGRFPGRNVALGRATSAEEREYLSQPGTNW